MSNQIAVAQLITLKHAVKLESLGMKRSGRSAKSIACEKLGLTKKSGYDSVIGALDREINKQQAALVQQQVAV